MESVIKNTELLENKENLWPDLPLNQWEDTYDTIHLWSQIIGKIQLEYSPFINHWWNVTFSLTGSGFTTGIVPYKNWYFEIAFNFITHQLVIKRMDGKKIPIALKSGTVADFYYEVKDTLRSLGIDIDIWTVPVEIEDRLPFDQDHRPRRYDPEYVTKFWRSLLHANKIMRIFRSGFRGKASPVHFFWGSLDLAVTFFSGRPAPAHPGAPNVGRKVMAESYNSELASFGFWGGKGVGEAAFYAYAYPEPGDYRNFAIEPKEAYYKDVFKEFILPYSTVRIDEFPEKKVLEFYRSAFKAAEELSNWDRSLYTGSLNP